MNAALPSAAQAGTPVVRSLRVVPVAGRDGMLLNLSGAHAPYFTRNLLILADSAGNTGVGEVPGGEKIRQTLEDARVAARSKGPALIHGETGVGKEVVARFESERQALALMDHPSIARVFDAGRPIRGFAGRCCSCSRLRRGRRRRP